MNMLDKLAFPYEHHRANHDRLVVFLPSVRSKAIYPYYPRISLKDKISHADTLYLADPFQDQAEYAEPGGSWYIDTAGKSDLFRIAEVLEEWLKQSTYKKVVFYGSSMGGYAALVLASLVRGSSAIAECPQTDLLKHPGSSYVINRFCNGSTANLPDIDSLCKRADSSSFHIIVNLHDHHVAAHVLPFMKSLGDGDPATSPNIAFSYYSSCRYRRGHTALEVADALHYLDMAFDENIFLNHRVAAG
jgi:hypothetical protein